MPLSGEGGRRGVLVGRADELERLGQWRDTGGRLLTLTGPPGVGKSRLAREFWDLTRAAWAADAGGDGVGFGGWVSLQAVGDLEGLARRVADVLGVEKLREESAVSEVSRHLARSRPLRLMLVLDNLESLLPQAVEVLGEWLRQGSAAVQWLVTSRERLRLPDEEVLELRPLAVPSDEQLGGDPAQSPAAQSPAVQLFVARARGLDPAFSPSGGDWGEIARIVRRLDGLPLAIELAAARLNLMDVQQLAARLDQVARDSAAALEAAIEGSWLQLDPAEREALAQLATFRGGFTLEAAEALLSESDVSDAGNTNTSALDKLQRLRDRSLIRSEPQTDTARQPRPQRRLGMYVSIQEFTARQRTAPERLRDERRHAAHFARAARAWVHDYGQTGNADVLQHLHAERDNLLAVVERMLAPPHIIQTHIHDPEAVCDGLWAALALDIFLDVCGPLSQHKRLSEQLLPALSTAPTTAEPLTPSKTPPELTVRLWLGRSRLLSLIGDQHQARACVEVAQTHAGADPLLGAYVKQGWINLHRLLPLAHCVQLCQESLAVFRAARAEFFEINALIDLAALYFWLSRWQDAIELYEQITTIAQRLRATRLVSKAQVNLCLLHAMRGHNAEALPHGERALASFIALGDLRGEATTLGHLGIIHLQRNQLDDATRDLTQAIHLHGLTDFREQAGFSLANLAEVSFVAHRLDDAERLCHQSELTNLACPDAALLAHNNLLRAEIAAARGHIPRALSLLLSLIDSLTDNERLSETLTSAYARAGVCLCLLDRSAEAPPFFQKAFDLASQVGLSTLLYATQLHALHLDPTSDPSLRALAQALSPVQSDPCAGIHNSQYVRRAARTLWDRLSDTHLAEVAALLLAPAPALLLDTPRQRLRTQSHPDWIVLHGKARLMRLLEVLIEHRRLHPGDPLSALDMVERIWPGERILPDAASNRLYNAMTQLRRAGLRDTIERHADGYRISPSIDLFDTSTFDPFSHTWTPSK